jgi:hypothetical protein
MSLLSDVLENTKAAATPVAQPVEPAKKRRRTEKERIEELKEQERLAAASGFTLDEQLFALGHGVNSAGVENLTLIQKEVNEKPLMVEGCEKLRDTVVKENRNDFEVEIKNLSIGPETGLLHTKPGSTGAEFSELGFKQLMTMLPLAPPTAGQYLSAVSPDRRSREFDEIIKRSNGRKVILRVRYPGGRVTPQVYSVITKRYKPFGALELAETLLDMSRSNPDLREYRSEIDYRGGSASIKLFGVTDIDPRDAGCGEVFKAVLNLKTSDDKTSGTSGTAGLFRNLCLNFIMIGESRQKVFSVRHIGDPSEMASLIMQGIEEGQSLIAPFMEMWGKAGRVDAIDVIQSVKRMAAAEEGAKKAQAIIQVPGVKPEMLVNWILEAYNKEPEPTQRGVVNAITRTPQVGSWKNPSLVEEMLAEQASQVLTMEPAQFQAFGAQ